MKRYMKGTGSPALCSTAIVRCQPFCHPRRQLQGCQVYLAGQPSPLDITSLWSEQDRVVLVFGRSMGEGHGGCGGSVRWGTPWLLAYWRR